MKNFFTEDGEYYFKIDMGGGDKFVYKLTTTTIQLTILLEHLKLQRHLIAEFLSEIFQK